MFWTILSASGLTAVNFTSLISMEVTRDGDTVSTPVELGSFASYNKIQKPAVIKVSLGLEGDQYLIDLAILAIKELQKTTALVSLCTPSSLFESLTIKSHNYKYEKTAGMLTVNLPLAEVRQAGTQALIGGFGLPAVKQPARASTQNTGNVQTRETSTPSQNQAQNNS